VNQPLTAPLEIGFDYTRSLGPTLSQFMTALAGRRILGARGADGRVHAPPFEYDPVTLAPPDELVPVGPEGSVTSWSWAPRPLEGQPLAHPFAWALIRLDGADTAMLHAVDAGSAAMMHTGMRVRVRWAASTVGHIRDIACFEPYDVSGTDGAAGAAAAGRAGGHDHDAGAAALRAHGVAGREQLPARARRRQAARAALPGLRQGLHPAARGLPHLRGADHRRGGAGPIMAP